MRDHRLLFVMVLAVACYGLAVAEDGAKPSPKPEKNSDKPEIKRVEKPPVKLIDKPADNKALLAAIDAFGEAFNAHDAAKVGAAWAPDAVYTDRDSGEKIEGRENIQAAYADIFERRPTVNLAASVHSIRMVTPDVAQVEATITVGDAGKPADGEETAEPIATDFSAIFKLVKGKWLLDSGVETELPQPATVHDHLGSLDWLVGEWHDEGTDENVKVRNAFRWSPKKTFLIRTFHAEIEGEVTREGTQVIGWDPEAEQIRSWIFGADGGFGEGYWEEEDDRWVAKLTGVLPDGRRAAVTQILKRTGPDSMTSQLTGGEIDGELQPAKPAVRMKRVPVEE